MGDLLGKAEQLVPPGGGETAIQENEVIKLDPTHAETVFNTLSHDNNPTRALEALSTDNMPDIAAIKAKVRKYSDEDYENEYREAILPYYDVTTLPPTRIKPLDYTHEVGDSEQVIVNLGTSHDKDPNSSQNILIRQRVIDYLAKVPPEQQIFLLEGLNTDVPTDLLDSFRQQPEEPEEEWYKRLVTTIGEQGIGLYYAYKNNAAIDLETESSINEQVQACIDAGVTRTEMAANIFPKFLDIYRNGNAFKQEDILTQEQIFEALSKVALFTGWRVLPIPAAGEATLNPDQRKQFIDTALAEMNTVMQRETGHPLVSGDYHPQFSFANDLARYRNESALINTVFQVTGDSRDYHLLERVYESVQNGKSPFLIFGDSHTFKIEPAVEALADHSKM